MIKFKTLLLFAALILAPASAIAESNVFPVPDILKHNVAFWIRIYTEISLKEGLLHDRDHPQVTYEKISSGDRTGKALSEHIDSRRKVYAAAIVAVRDSSPNKWGAVEKRVVELFKQAPEGALEDAENRIRHQTGQRERFRQGLERSTIYLDTISAILKKHGVPDELKYLPHVESSFDAGAYSRVGAAGLWQFMRSTGRLYMKVDYMIDERSDPVIATNAAAKFLRANYDMLQTWPLAITAYNHGPNGMRRAVESLGSRDIAVILQKHESSSFKFASKNFYGCFLAVLQIVEKPDKYFKNLNFKPKFSATSVKLPFAIKPDVLCKALDITENEFRALNLSFRPIVFSQKKPIPAGYAVNVPDKISAADALAAINRTPAPQRAAPREAEPDADGYYTIVGGDNLQGIAKRLGVPMNDLVEANNITNSSKIYVGQVLRIPTGSGSGSTVTSTKAKAGTKAVDTADVVLLARIDAAESTKGTATKAAVVDTAKAKKVAVTDTAKVKKVAAVDTAKAKAKTVSVDTVKTKVIVIDTAKTKVVVIDTAKPKAVVIDTVKTKIAPIDTAKTKVVLVDTAKSKAAVIDTVKIKIAPIDTAKTKVVLVDTAKSKAAVIDTVKIKIAPIDTAKTKVAIVDTLKTKAILVDTAKAKTVSVDTVKSKTAIVDTVKIKIAPIDTAKTKVALVDTAKPKAVIIDTLKIETAKPTKINPNVKPSTDPNFDADAYDLNMTVATGGSSVRVRVSVDETVGHFAEWMRVYTADIRRANNIPDGGTPPLGTFVLIPISSSTNIKKFEVNRLQYHMAIEEDFFARYSVTDFEQRKVRSGDNLWRLCSGAQVPMWLLKKYNRGVNFYALQPGNTLWIPKVAPKDAAAATGNEFEPAVSESDALETE